MSLIKVWTETDDGATTSLPAKIIETKNGIYSIKYLSVTDKRDQHNRKIYMYEDETYTITDESVTEYLDSDMEIDFGFQSISENEFIKYDSDSDDDYTPSDDENDGSSSDDEDEDDDEETCDEDDYLSEISS